VDISLVDGIPTVLQVIEALKPNFVIGQAYMAEEFKEANDTGTVAKFQRALAGIPLSFEAHADLKKRVPLAIGLIRTADTVQYANTILVSA
jgi:D-ribose pyranase